MARGRGNHGPGDANPGGPNSNHGGGPGSNRSGANGQGSEEGARRPPPRRPTGPPPESAADRQARLQREAQARAQAAAAAAEAEKQRIASLQPSEVGDEGLYPGDLSVLNNNLTFGKRRKPGAGPAGAVTSGAL